MFEKVNPAHPDKVADRIAGAIVDWCYRHVHDPKVAVEVLIGHGACHVIAETDQQIDTASVENIVHRIARENVAVDFVLVPQDPILAGAQHEGFRCGDNGIFKGTPVTDEQRQLTKIARLLYAEYGTDGKYLIEQNNMITVCQSNALTKEIELIVPDASFINPLGKWSGGINVDTGATNRKLGSDMGDSVTGGGLHGKDLSKADVSVNIWCWLEAQRTGTVVERSCSIGDSAILPGSSFGEPVPYEEIVRVAREYISSIGGFEKFAEWGLIR